jgi:hypothetical protein
LSTIHASANRRLWTDQVQQALTAVASRAVHGNLPNADAADAIFFNSLEEALETLLRAALRHSKTDWAKPAWYSNSLLGDEAGAAYSAQIPVILQQLRPPAIAPGAAAAILFAALGGNDAAALLRAVPSTMIRDWVREQEGQKSLDVSAPPLDLPSEMKAAIRQVALQYGWRDPATIWLAAQAVICISPGSWSGGTAVKHARAIVRAYEAERTNDPLSHSTPPRGAALRSLVFGDEDSAFTVIQSPSAKTPSTPEPQRSPDALHPPALPAHTSVFDRISDFQIPASEDVLAKAALENPTASTPPLLGETTKAAGLFFLLNVLRRVGIVSALDRCPALVESGLVTEIMTRLGVCAGVAEDDPILSCLLPMQVPFVLPPDVITGPPNEIWPRRFAPSHRSASKSEHLVRAWVIAVKQWCWRVGRITVRDIVRRSGRVWRTRTDLDVTLLLSEVDIRIRRIGLDIDPGWLPWFGQYGCVVRFHYSDQKPGVQSC